MPHLTGLQKEEPGCRCDFPEAVKHMVIEYNEKIKVVNPKPHLNGGKSKPNPTLGKPNSNPQQIHLHEKDDSTENNLLKLLRKLWFINA